jgi:hypothetical protein
MMGKNALPTDEPYKFDDMADPVLKAIRFAYKLERRNKNKNVPWNGPRLGENMRANSPEFAERLRAGRLAYAEEDQGRDALEEIIGIALQVGIEQGRRIAKSSQSALLDRAYGAVFKITVGHDHTSIHTQSGFQSSPVECLNKAIGALQEELSKVAKCPRYRELASYPKQGRSFAEEVHDAAVAEPNPRGER